MTPADALRTWGADYWAAAAGRAHDAGLEWADELVRLLPVIAELEGYVEAAYHDPTPLLLSHRDSDMKNVVRTPAGAMMLVDWDAAGPVNPRHDVANNALVWAGLHRGDPDPALARSFIDAYRRGSGAGEAFRPTDLAELVAARLGWFDFNVRRALGERTRDDADRRAGVGVFHRNAEQLPRFARSLDAWLAVLGAPPA